MLSLYNLNRYDIDSNEWHNFDATNTIARQRNGRWTENYKLCVYRDLIFKMTYDIEDFQNTTDEPAISCFDPINNTWHSIIQIDERDYGQNIKDIFVYNDVLYVIWSHIDEDDDDDQFISSTVESFDVNAHEFSLVDLYTRRTDENERWL